jgi:hypothetical protein
MFEDSEGMLRSWDLLETKAKLENVNFNDT